MANERGKPDFSDVQGGSSTAPAKPAAPDFSDVKGGSSTSPTSERLYTVLSGDSLSRIAKKLYGDANAWKAIYEANRDKISNPDLIHPGQVLRIPPR